MKYLKEYNEQLNDNFWKWFGESKVVDEDGNPRIMYHSSENEFDEFDEKTIKYVGNNGDGFYFSPDKVYTYMYGENTKECYLSIENPLSPKDIKLSLSDYKKLLDAIWADEEYSQDLKNYGYFDDSDFIDFRNKLAQDFVDRKDDYVALFDLTTSSTGSIRYIAKLLKENTDVLIDGVISPVFREYVAFFPNQIKSATNNNGDFNKKSNNINEAHKRI